MKLTRLSSFNAEKIWNSWTKQGAPVIPAGDLNSDELKFRDGFEKLVQASGGCKEAAKDPVIALGLYYSLLPLKAGYVSLRMASDDDIWRNLTMRCIPDFVAQRWGMEQSTHFYSMNQRNWLKAAWWYGHFSDIEFENETPEKRNKASDKMLKKIVKHSDLIQGLVERPGKRGYNIALNRALLARIAQEDLCKNVDKIRRLLVLNTAACKMSEPALHASGIEGFVNGLVSKLS